MRNKVEKYQLAMRRLLAIEIIGSTNKPNSNATTGTTTAITVAIVIIKYVFVLISNVSLRVLLLPLEVVDPNTTFLARHSFFFRVTVRFWWPPNRWSNAYLGIDPKHANDLMEHRVRWSLRNGLLQYVQYHTWLHIGYGRHTS